MFMHQTRLTTSHVDDMWVAEYIGPNAPVAYRFLVVWVDPEGYQDWQLILDYLYSEEEALAYIKDLNAEAERGVYYSPPRSLVE